MILNIFKKKEKRSSGLASHEQARDTLETKKTER